MTTLSFRVADEEAAEAQRVAEARGVDRSELLRDALHRHLVALRGEEDAAKRQRPPASAAGAVFRRRIAALTPARMAHACRALRDAVALLI